MFALCSGSSQKYSNPVYMSPDKVPDETKESETIKNKDDATTTDGGTDERTSITEEPGVDL